jgi:hypothetical protein
MGACYGCRVKKPRPDTGTSDAAALPPLSLRQVRYFVTLAHGLNFTQAAQLLAVPSVAGRLFPALTAVALTEPRVSRAIALISSPKPDRGPQVATARDWILGNL